MLAISRYLQYMPRDIRWVAEQFPDFRLFVATRAGKDKDEELTVLDDEMGEDLVQEDLEGVFLADEELVEDEQGR